MLALLLAASIAQPPVTITTPTDPLGRLSVGGVTLSPVFPGYAGPVVVTIAKPDPPAAPYTCVNSAEDPPAPATVAAINAELTRLTDSDVAWLRKMDYKVLAFNGPAVSKVTPFKGKGGQNAGDGRTYDQIYAVTLPPFAFIGSKSTGATNHEIGHLYFTRMIRDTPGKEAEWMALHKSIAWPHPSQWENFEEAAAEAFRLTRADQRALIHSNPADDKRVKDFVKGLVGLGR